MTSSPKFKLETFGTSCMVWAGAGLRLKDQTFSSMEEVAQGICTNFWDRFENADGGPAFSLIRVYRTILLSRLPKELQQIARSRGYDGPDVKCLTLLGTRGLEPQWNDNKTSVGHRVIAMPDPDFVHSVPMLSELFTSFGLNVDGLLNIRKLEFVNKQDTSSRLFNVFHVEDALGSSHIPAQSQFVIPYKVKSVIGFGGFLPDGDIYAIIGFTRAKVSTEVAERFNTLTLHCRVPLADFAFGPVFDGDKKPEEITPTQLSEIRKQSLEQVLAEHELRVWQQSKQIEKRGKEMQAILDNIDQGLILITNDGSLVGDTSASIQQWFGSSIDGAKIWDLFAAHDPKLAEYMKLSFETLREELMPEDVIVSQLPKRLTANSLIFDLKYTCIYKNKKLSQILVILSDVTEKINANKKNQEQQALVSVLSRLTEDPTCLKDYFIEVEQLIHNLYDSKQSLREIRRHLHTIKGISAIFGISPIANTVHELEEQLLDVSDLESRDIFDELRDQIADFKTKATAVAPQQQTTLSLEPTELLNIIQAVQNQQTQEAINALHRLNLEPIRRRFIRMQTEIKTLAKKLGKGNIKVIIEDGNVRLDSNIWKRFFSEFIHVVRNSVDHGLETPQEREIANKTKFGTIKLRAYETPEQLVIEITDDGKGVHWDKIKTKAQNLGLIADTQAQIIEILFSDGFSTRDKVTQTSGRGVGLASFRAAVEELGGHISMVSEVNKGTTFKMSFPHSRLNTKVA